MKSHLPPIAIATGDPCGVGPHISLEALERFEHRALWYGDAHWYNIHASPRLKSRSRIVTEEQLLGDGQAPIPPPVGDAREVTVVHVASWEARIVSAHRDDPASGGWQLAALRAGAEATRAGVARALCTAPTSKAAICGHGTAFSGQTEWLAQDVGLAPDDVTMMFLGPRLRVALCTTHLSLSQVPKTLRQKHVRRTVLHLVEALQALSASDNEHGPETSTRSVVVSGLNPHASEGGLFGSEEARVISPALERVIPELLPGATVHGPMGAESAFRLAVQGTYQGVVAMTHDQGTIASKLVDWGHAVNVTWGLPFVRTSVDHGVAFEAARTGSVDASAMNAALQMAHRLTATVPIAPDSGST